MAVHGTSPLTPQSQKAFETAVKLNIPVNIHTGNDVPCGLPSLASPVAKAYPELSMVLAHSGAGMYGAEALIANITLVTSLTTVMEIPSFIRKLGAERVMFGTDIPLNASAELGKYKALHLTEEPYGCMRGPPTGCSDCDGKQIRTCCRLLAGRLQTCLPLCMRCMRS